MADNADGRPEFSGPATYLTVPRNARMDSARALENRWGQGATMATTRNQAPREFLQKLPPTECERRSQAKGLMPGQNSIEFPASGVRHCLRRRARYEPDLEFPLSKVRLAGDP